MEATEQQLFLMEFLVDRVNIPSVKAIQEDVLPVTTCVSFQILNLPAINIYQEASTADCTCTSGDTQVFKKGKSCLFALPSAVVEKPLHSFPVTLTVYKKLPPGVLPDVMTIGSHQIQTKDLFNTLLQKRLEGAGNPCKTMKDTFKITTATGQNVGEVTVFIRVSCFGKKIVTQFQIPHNKKPYLFKGAANSPVFQCKRIPSDIGTKSVERCICKKEEAPGGGGEAALRTCCPPISAEVGFTSPSIAPAAKIKADFSPRPCCPLKASQNAPAGGNKGPTCQQLKNQSNVASPCCGAQPRISQNYPAGAASSPGQMQGQIGNLGDAGNRGCCSGCGSSYGPSHATNLTRSANCAAGGSTAAGWKSDLYPKEPQVRQCGCVVKDERTCDCGRIR
ncbi:uncharacterized protein LOC105702731 [Orussus abietinus]|uniref:uncharacterized protein LOC105702731 n=1 Tax=Orussus abietinus TaxID=222816 RepID=UPI00062594BE|nr:uncharacterized protein LOC105702731 [Orussus abietinus]